MVDAVFHTTDGIERERTLEYWRHTALPGADIRILPEAPPLGFQATRLFAPTHAAAFIDTRCLGSGFIVDRRLRHVRQDGQDQVSIAMMRHGTAVHSQAGRDHALSPGSVLIGDRTKPLQLATVGAYEEIRLQFPRALFRTVVGDPEPLAGRLFEAGNPLVDLIFLYAQELRLRVSAMTTQDAEAAFQAVLVLVRGLADTVRDRMPAHTGAFPDALVDTVRAYVVRRLHDPALDAAEIVERLHISRTRLYDALKPHVGVRTFIRDLRLDRIRTELAAGRPDAIGAIAAQYGFTDQNNFTRAFRQRFDMSPSAFRIAAADRRNVT